MRICYPEENYTSAHPTGCEAVAAYGWQCNLLLSSVYVFIDVAHIFLFNRTLLRNNLILISLATTFALDVYIAVAVGPGVYRGMESAYCEYNTKRQMYLEYAMRTNEFLDGLVTHKEFEEEDCAICLNELQVGEAAGVVKLDCGHLYHYRCAAEWFLARRKYICPLCKKDFTYVQRIFLKMGVQDDHFFDTHSLGLTTEEILLNLYSGTLYSQQEVLDAYAYDLYTPNGAHDSRDYVQSNPSSLVNSIANSISESVSDLSISVRFNPDEEYGGDKVEIIVNYSLDFDSSHSSVHEMRSSQPINVRYSNQNYVSYENMETNLNTMNSENEVIIEEDICNDSRYENSSKCHKNNMIYLEKVDDYEESTQYLDSTYVKNLSENINKAETKVKLKKASTYDYDYYKSDSKTYQDKYHLDKYSEKYKFPIKVDYNVEGYEVDFNEIEVQFSNQ